MFKTIKPKTVMMSQSTLVKAETESFEQFPVLLQPNVENVNLIEWAKNNHQLIETMLLKQGAVLFRGFKIDSMHGFEQFVRSFPVQLINYGERSSPRTRLSSGLYTSTDHPADQYILLHNEQSYTLNWPMKIWFFCLIPAQQGGGTPIADSRKILRNLDSNTVQQFAEKQIMYVRNYGDGLGLPWQEVFQTNDKSIVEQHCRNAGIEFDWKNNNRLRTRQIRPAIRNHPKTGELVWFNHAFFFHISSLHEQAREFMLEVLSEDEFPFNTFYGDGSPIENSVIDEIRQIYKQETVVSPWQEQDILMLDNMLVAHGREPYTGPRKIVVAMAEAFSEIGNA
jgi:alpha-ketoglutarate-dependent taurine dioxygenase